MLRQRKESSRPGKRNSLSPRPRTQGVTRQEIVHEVVLQLPIERPSFGEHSQDDSATQGQRSTSRGSVDVDFYI